jgi:hypothetical protein
VPYTNPPSEQGVIPKSDRAEVDGRKWAAMADTSVSKSVKVSNAAAVVASVTTGGGGAREKKNAKPKAVVTPFQPFYGQRLPPNSDPVHRTGSGMVGSLAGYQFHDPYIQMAAFRTPTSSSHPVAVVGGANPSIAADDGESRRKLLSEVREHLDLLKEFEGVISAEELAERKRQLFLALPPAPPSLSFPLPPAAPCPEEGNAGKGDDTSSETDIEELTS